MQSRAAQVPEEQKAFFQAYLKKMQNRIAELEAGK